MQRTFLVPDSVKPCDLEVDSHGRFYLSDPAANRVYQLDRDGKITRTFGRRAAQQPGAYDPETFISPGKLAVWTDAQADDRLLVVDDGGPNRVSEWNADGRLLRTFVPPQTRANDGWTIDPDHPEHAYIAGQKDWLVRFKVDYERHTWTIDAVWPDVPDLRRPVFIRRNGLCYLACRLTSTVYRLDGQRWVPSAKILCEGPPGKSQYFAWHDANGDGQVQPDEKIPLEMPGGLLRYHGNNWLADLSLVSPNQSGPDVWRLAPAEFDTRGNPVFRRWQKVLTDPVFAARRAGTATRPFRRQRTGRVVRQRLGPGRRLRGRGFLRQCPRRPFLQRQRRRSVQGFTLRARGARRLPDRLAHRPRRLAAIGPTG